MQRGQLSIAARLLLGRLASCRASGGHSTKELSVISRWSESKVRTVLSDLEAIGLICAIEAPSFERGRPRVDYRLKINPEHIFVEQHELGLSMSEQLLGTRVNAPKKDLDCYLLVVLWLEAKVGTLWSEMSIELLQELGVSENKAQGALDRLAAGGWLNVTNDDAPCGLSKARFFLLSLDNFASVTQRKGIRLPAPPLNVLDADYWVKRGDEFEPDVARRLADLSSWLFITLYNEGIIGSDSFKTWADQARNLDDSGDAPYVVTLVETMMESVDLLDFPDFWSSYLTLFSSLNVSAEYIRKQGFYRLNLVIAERPKVNLFALLTINQRYA